MKALQIVVIGLFLSGCGLMPGTLLSTPTLTPTATPIRTPSFTPSPDPAVTQKAILAMTQTAYVGNLQVKSTAKAKSASTAIAQFATVLEEIRNTSSEMEDLDISQAEWVYGPVGATLRGRSGDIVVTYDPGLSLANFIASIKFVNPPDTANAAAWDYGILFRSNPGNDQYRLIVRSDRSWAVMNANTWLDVSSGTDENIHVMAGESNVIWLIVSNTRAYLFINDIYLDTLNVKAKLTPGDVSPATGLEVNVAGTDIQFTDFAVWSLP